MSLLQNSNAISAGGYDVNNSLRFRSSASAYLSRTPASAGNRQKWTWSGWIKRGILGGASNVIFNCYNTTSTTQTSFEFANDTFGVFSNDSSTVNINLYTTQVFRDPSAWYHFVVVFDTTQATSSNRIKIYVNGSQITAFSTSTYPSLNYNGHINTTSLHTIFATRTPSGLIDGYLAETNFIDGQALTPSSFGATDATTGVWQPKAYTGTYGTNGFYLKFSDIATTSGSNAGLGKDFSGNANYWTTNNISVTSGTTYDAMTDSPTLTSPTVANYCVLNAASIGTDATLSNANLTIAYGTGGTIKATMGTFGMSSGKWYWEITTTASSLSSTTAIYGITNGPSSSDFPEYPGQNANGWGYYGNNGNKFNNNTATSYGASYGVNDVIGVAFDADAGSLTFYKNNVSQGVAFSGLPAATYFPAVGDGSVGNTFTSAFNFGQRPFTYTPPTGYVALNTYNLPTPTILQGNKYMDATLYNGATTGFSVTNAGSFAPDMLWIKLRNAAGSHVVVDSVRGSSKVINTDLTNAEATSNAGTGVLSLNSNGFTLGTDTSTAGVTNGVGTGSRNFVAWQWQAGQGTTSSNTNGSITSTVSVNTTAGFSVVTFSNTTTGSTIGHGLGVAPKMMIVKDRGSVSNWQVYHASLGNNAQLRLNTTDAQNTPSNLWNTTTPTSTVFTFGSGFAGSYSYVVYCFAEIAGFSRFGSYTGNSSTDGPFIYTGFRPKFVLFKISSGSTGNWFIVDTSRSTYNEAVNLLNPDTADAAADVSPFIDILSNGIKIRRNSVGLNNSGYTYIYAAFAESPFKNSLAR